MNTEIRRLLDESLRSRLLFGRHDEPLNAYGLRLVRVILAELERTAALLPALPPDPSVDGAELIATIVYNRESQQIEHHAALPPDDPPALEDVKNHARVDQSPLSEPTGSTAREQPKGSR